MLVKQIFEEYGLPIEKIINKEYKRLGLTLPESMVLLALFAMYERRNTFSIISISRRVEYDRGEIGNLVSKLESKNFIKIKVETAKDGKVKEVFTLDPAFNKIEVLIKKDLEDKVSKMAASHIAEIISKLENGLGRVLSAYEMDLIRHWYLNKNLSYEQIESEVDKAIASGKVSINNIDRILMAEPIDTTDVDPKTAKILDQIYKKIK